LKFMYFFKNLKRCFFDGWVKVENSSTYAAIFNKTLSFQLFNLIFVKTNKSVLSLKYIFFCLLLKLDMIELFLSI